jgi:hypothetical protein
MTKQPPPTPLWLDVDALLRPIREQRAHWKRLRRENGRLRSRMAIELGSSHPVVLALDELDDEYHRMDVDAARFMATTEREVARLVARKAG